MDPFIPPTYKKLTPFKRCVLQNFPFIEQDFDALTNYGLLCKVVAYLNNVISSQNQVTENITALNNAFIELKDYVDNYFANLDVQEEINNKLDAMAEAGTLSDIISQYLNSTAVFGYDKVADMKNAENLVNGSYARTLGYHAKNDGGGALYKIRNITNDDVIDEGSIIEMNDDQNQLVAELISEETVTPEMFGAYGDGTHDDTSSLQNSLNYGKKVYAKGTYIVSSTINVKDSIDMDGNSYIKADNSLTTKVVLIAPNYKVGCTYNINVDSSGVAGIGIAVGSPRKAILNLNVINAGTTGIDCNNLSSTGNNENEFKCNVIGNSSGTTVTGVLCNCFDSIFSSITTQDCQRGVEVNNGELIATSVHSWLSDATASSLWSNSCAVYNPSYYNTVIEWLYQDSVKYGYLCNGAYGHITFLEYNNTLTDHSTLYNDYTNVKTTGGAVRITIDNYKNVIDENSYLKYDISQSSSNEFGVTNKNGVASILSAVQSKLPFSDANDAPQWGTFSCPYTITNMGSSTNGVLKCEVVGYYAVQKFYRDDFTDVPREYIRMRKLGTSTWTAWKYYSPAA